LKIAHLSTAVTGCIAAAEQEVGGEVGGVADVSHVEARTAAAAGKAFAALPREEMLSQDSVSIAYDKEGGKFVWDILLPGMEVTEDVRKPVPQAPPDADLSKPLSRGFF